MEVPLQGGGALPALSAALLRGRRFQAQSKQLFLHPTEPCATAPGGRAAVLTLLGTDCSLGSRQRNSCLRLHTERFELCWAHQSASPRVLASRASFRHHEGERKDRAAALTAQGLGGSPYVFGGLASSSSNPSSGSRATASS